MTKGCMCQHTQTHNCIYETSQINVSACNPPLRRLMQEVRLGLVQGHHELYKVQMYSVRTAYKPGIPPA